MKGTLEPQRGKKGALLSIDHSIGAVPDPGKGTVKDGRTLRSEPVKAEPRPSNPRITGVPGTQRGFRAVTSPLLQFPHGVNTPQSHPCYSLYPVSLDCFLNLPGYSFLKTSRGLVCSPSLRENTFPALLCTQLPFFLLCWFLLWMSQERK